ncbi:hypothetical protein [Hymenobacter psychrophilus]|uniref:Lipoprotein n=1 Tax=Hymenobacter psychrophilus TaxID=651662 RepID=A0A1H3FHC3_9BACT|nr:hypothetical protein [Hymenobacter psychrophilus]SDX90442.1 hypothetical protein SAMN04488069_10479 [Hymenobacter psychrophilus]
MRLRLLLPALLPLAAACSGPADQPAGSATTAVAPDTTGAAAPEPLDTARAATVNAQSDTLLVRRNRHVFSNPAAPDVFTLVLRGPSVLSGEATFTITTATGEVIFREIMTSPELEAALVYEMKTPTATQAEREAYVRRRVQEFFAATNFQRPALAPTAAYPSPAPASPDRATWNDLRQRPDAVRFNYLVGKEDRRHLAWSPLSKQVVHLP